MNKTHQECLLFAGTSHNELAEEIAANLNIPLGKISTAQFPDGEISVEILECVRGRNVFILQTIAQKPNHFLMELLIIIDALKRASAKSIAVIIPYFGYSRQDRKTDTRVPITAKLVANLLETAGAKQILTMDLHAPQVQGFFDIPVDNLQASPALLEAVKQLDFKDFVVVTPDIGSVKLARAISKATGAEYVIIEKSRISPTEVSVHNLIGSVEGKNVLLTDDICSTAGTLVAAAEACHAGGAKRIIGAVTHGLFVGDAIKEIERSHLETLLISNTIPLSENSRHCKKIIQVSIAKHFSHAISCIAGGRGFLTP